LVRTLCGRETPCDEKYSNGASRRSTKTLVGGSNHRQLRRVAPPLSSQLDRESPAKPSAVRTLNLNEAAAFLHMHPEEVRTRAKRGLIPGAKAGRCWIFLDVDPAEFVRSLYPVKRQALRVTNISQEDVCHYANAGRSCILIKYGMRRLPANAKCRPTGRPWHRYEKSQPGHRLQIDVKFLERIAGSRKRLYQFTAIDDCTRIRVLKIYDVCNQKSAISFVDEVIRRLPFRVLVIQTDNGAEFQSNFHWHLEERDIRHVYIRPKTPRLNGKVAYSGPCRPPVPEHAGP
jgi:hypothetical protein